VSIPQAQTIRDFDFAVDGERRIHLVWTQALARPKSPSDQTKFLYYIRGDDLGAKWSTPALLDSFEGPPARIVCRQDRLDVIYGYALAHQTCSINGPGWLARPRLIPDISQAAHSFDMMGDGDGLHLAYFAYRPDSLETSDPAQNAAIVYKHIAPSDAVASS